MPDVYAVGDVASIPVGDKAVPKAGAFPEDAARTVVSDHAAQRKVSRRRALEGGAVPAGA